MVSIVIPVMNNLLYTQMIVGLIEQVSEIAWEIIIIDNESTEKGMQEYLNRIDHNVIFNPENIGIVKSWNLGVEEAIYDTVLIMNNDVIIGDKSIDALFNTLHSTKDLYCISPVYVNGDLSRKYKDLEYKTRTSKGELVQGGLGCMFMFKKSVYNMIENPKSGYLFDEQFTMFFEDTDFFQRLNDAKIPAMSLTSVCIHHFDRQTTGTNPRIKELFKENYERFNKKHNNKLRHINIQKLIEQEL